MGVDAITAASAKSNSALNKNSGASLDMQDFLNLIVAQLKNQDVMNPMDNTQFISQMAQFSSLEAMSSVAEISQQSQATSLIGKTVSALGYDSKGNLIKTEGAVEKVTISGGEASIYVKGVPYGLSDISEIKSTKETENKDSTKNTENVNETENTSGTE